MVQLAAAAAGAERPMLIVMTPLHLFSSQLASLMIKACSAASATDKTNMVLRW